MSGLTAVSLKQSLYSSTLWQHHSEPKGLVVWQRLHIDDYDYFSVSSLLLTGRRSRGEVEGKKQRFEMENEHMTQCPIHDTQRRGKADVKFFCLDVNVWKRTKSAFYLNHLYPYGGVDPYGFVGCLWRVIERGGGMLRGAQVLLQFSWGSYSHCM